MAESKLVLHCGSRQVSFDEMAAVNAPEPTESWFPVPHRDVFGVAKQTLEAAGFQIERAKFGLSKDDAQFFGVIDLASHGVAEGVALSVGLRNSTNKTLPMGFCGGSRVFVCDNLSFGAELLLKRKHTVNGSIRYKEAIGYAVSGLVQYRAIEVTRFQYLNQLELSDDRANSLILQGFEAGIISTRTLPKVIQEWRRPSHDAFLPRTGFSLFNAFTEALKTYQSNPQDFTARTINLGALLCPPNEGPVIDAEFEVV